MPTDPALTEERLIDDGFDDSEPQKFFRLSIAYAQSSHHLFKSIIDGSIPATFAHAQPAHFLFDHAVELFLKGAILKSAGTFDTKHNLDELYNRYRKLYPKREYELSGRIADTVARNPDSPHSEFPRYPVDRNGNVWNGYNVYTPTRWEKEVASFCADLAKFVPMIDPLPTSTL